MACEEVRNRGSSLARAAEKYSADTLDKMKREGMHYAAKQLLLSVTRLLAIVDLIDIHEFLKATSHVSLLIRDLGRYFLLKIKSFINKPLVLTG